MSTACLANLAAPGSSLRADPLVDCATPFPLDPGRLRFTGNGSFAFEPFAARAWALRATVTSYDAWYVAVAEAIATPLATLDLRLARAAGPRCRFQTP